MTTMPDALAISPTATSHRDALDACVNAASALIPASTTLRPGEPVAGSLGTTTGYAGAAIAEFTGAVEGGLAIVVGPDLVAALANSPMGELDLGQALQPAFDAAAAAMGAAVGAATTTAVDDVIDALGYPFTVVPLVGDSVTAQILIRDSSLESAAAASPAAVQEAPAAAFVGAPGTDPAALTVGTPIGRGLEMLHGVVMDVTVELGSTQMTIRELLALAPGTVLELDRAAGSPADLLVNGRLIARGEVVVVDEDFGLRVTEILDSAPIS